MSPWLPSPRPAARPCNFLPDPSCFLYRQIQGGSFPLGYLGASFLGVTACPRGRRSLGTRLPWGKRGETIGCFLGNRRVRPAPPFPAAEPRPARSGDPSPDDTQKTPPWGSPGAPGACCCLLLCLRVGGARFVWVGMVVVVSYGGTGRCRVCPGNQDPRRFLCFFIFFL